MSREIAKPKHSVRCYLCGNLIGGITGKDFQLVKTGKYTRYYCEKKNAQRR